MPEVSTGTHIAGMIKVGVILLVLALCGSWLEAKLNRTPEYRQLCNEHCTPHPGMLIEQVCYCSACTKGPGIPLNQLLE